MPPRPAPKTARTISIEKALKNKNRWQLHAPYVNSFTGKREAPMLYDGELVCVQLGTPEQPVYTPFGLNYWSQPDKKFKGAAEIKAMNYGYQQMPRTERLLRRANRTSDPGGDILKKIKDLLTKYGFASVNQALNYYNENKPK